MASFHYFPNLFWSRIKFKTIGLSPVLGNAWVKILTHQVENNLSLGGCNVSLEKELLKSCGITGNRVQKAPKKLVSG